MKKFLKRFLSGLLLSYFLSTPVSFGEDLKAMGFGFVVDNKALIYSKEKRGYYQLGMGLLVDQSCFKIHPPKKLAVIFQKMLVNGLSCMSDLKDAVTAKDDLALFQKLLSNKTNLPKIECNKALPDVAYAIGSSPGGSRNHPYIYLSSMGNDEFKKDQAFFEGVVFHELLHNIRYYHHPDSIEVTSACEECCFGKLAGDNKKAIACKICGGAYQDISDPEYLRALIAWDGKFYGRMLVEEYFEKSFLDPSILKKSLLPEALSAFITEIKPTPKLQVALGWVDKIFAGEIDLVEKELQALPQVESDHRIRYLFYRLMGQYYQSKKNVHEEKTYLEKAESFRQKYL